FARPAACRQDEMTGGDGRACGPRSRARLDAADPAAGDVEPGPRRVGAERYAQPLCGFRQGPRQPFVVHPVIAAHEESPADGWRESGDSLVDRLRCQTFERQALARLAAADLLEFPAVLVIGGYHQDSVATVPHGLAGQFLDFLD